MWVIFICDWAGLHLQREKKNKTKLACSTPLPTYSLNKVLFGYLLLVIMQHDSQRSRHSAILGENPSKLYKDWGMPSVLKIQITARRLKLLISWMYHSASLKSQSMEWTCRHITAVKDCNVWKSWCSLLNLKRKSYWSIIFLAGVAAKPTFCPERRSCRGIQQA